MVSDKYPGEYSIILIIILDMLSYIISSLTINALSLIRTKNKSVNIKKKRLLDWTPHIPPGDPLETLERAALNCWLTLQ